MHHGDLRIRQFHARIEFGDRHVIPLGNAAEEDAGERIAVEHEFAGFDAVDVVGRHDAADDAGKLAEPVFRQFIGVERLVGGAEIDRTGLDLGDAAARADRLVIDVVAGLLGEAGRPLGQHRIDEAGTRTGDIGGRGESGKPGSGDAEDEGELAILRHDDSHV